MLFANGTLQSPDFWMGVVCGGLGIVFIGAVCLNNLAKKTRTRSTDDEREKERNTYWWNEGKKPNFDQDD